MKEKKLEEDSLKKLEELVSRLEKTSIDKPHLKHPHPPVPHHLEGSNLKFQFENDEDLLVNIFGDVDTAQAIVEIMKKSPTEIQILFKVVVDLYKQINLIREKR